MIISALTLLIYTPIALLLPLPGGTSSNWLLHRSNDFMKRTINDWNSLPISVVESTSINTGIQALPLHIFNHVSSIAIVHLAHIMLNDMSGMQVR